MSATRVRSDRAICTDPIAAYVFSVMSVGCAPGFRRRMEATGSACRPALVVRHATPHSRVLAGVQRPGPALHQYRASPAHCFGFGYLVHARARRTDGEEQLRFQLTTRGPETPVHDASPLSANDDRSGRGRRRARDCGGLHLANPATAAGRATTVATSSGYTTLRACGAPAPLQRARYPLSALAGRGARRGRRCSSSSAPTGISIGWPGTPNIVTTNRVSASARLLPS